MKKILVFLLTAAVLLSLCACTPAPAITETERPVTAASTADAPAPELLPCCTYRCREVSLSNTLQPTGLSCRSGDTLYFLADIPVEKQTFTTGNETARYDVSESRVVAMEKDGSKLRILDGYSDLREQEGDNHTFAAGLFAGKDGSVWVRESTTYYTFDLPRNFDEATQNRWDYYQYRGEGTDFWNLTANGSVKHHFTLALNPHQTDCAALWHDTILCAREKELLVLNEEGELQRTAYLPAPAEKILLTENAPVVLFRENNILSYAFLDTEDWSFGERTELPVQGELLGGFNGSSLLCTVGGNVFSWDYSTNTVSKLVDWLDYNRVSTGISALWATGEDTLCALYQPETGGRLHLLQMLNRQEGSPEHALTMAALAPKTELLELACAYNQSHGSHRLRVVNYDEYAALGGSARETLQSDLENRNTVDLLYSSLRDTPTDVLGKGKLQDLTDLLRRDDDLQAQGGLLSCVTAALTDNGKLYALSPYFTLHAAVGCSEKLSASATLEELRSLVSEGCTLQEPAVTPADGFAEYLSFHSRRLAAPGEKSKAEQLVQAALQAADLCPAGTASEEPGWYRVRTGKQLLVNGQYTSFSALLSDLCGIGENSIFQGVPSLGFEETWSVTASCRSRDKAWAFVRMALSDENQNGAGQYGFPTNALAFSKAAGSTVTAGATSVAYGAGEKALTVPVALTDERQAQIDAFLEQEPERYQRDYKQISALWSVVSGCFDGTITAEQAVSAALELIGYESTT